MDKGTLFDKQVIQFVCFFDDSSFHLGNIYAKVSCKQPKLVAFYSFDVQ